MARALSVSVNSASVVGKEGSSSNCFTAIWASLHKVEPSCFMKQHTIFNNRSSSRWEATVTLSFLASYCLTSHSQCQGYSEMYVKRLSGILSAIVANSITEIPQIRLQLPVISAGVEKWLHTATSYSKLGEPQGLSQGTLTKQTSEAASQNAMCTLTDASLPHIPWCFKIQICFWSHCGYAWSIPGISAGTGYCHLDVMPAALFYEINNTHNENNNNDRVHVK